MQKIHLQIKPSLYTQRMMNFLQFMIFSTLSLHLSSSFKIMEIKLQSLNGRLMDIFIKVLKIKVTTMFLNLPLNLKQIIC